MPITFLTLDIQIPAEVPAEVLAEVPADVSVDLLFAVSALVGSTVTPEPAVLSVSALAVRVEVAGRLSQWAL